MEPWRQFWRAYQPTLPTGGLEALRKALVTGDPALRRGNTFYAPEGVIVAACSIGFPLWKTYDEPSSELGCRMQAVRENTFVAAPGWFSDWFDHTPLAESRPLLLAEVNAELARREEESDGDKLDSGSEPIQGSMDSQLCLEREAALSDSY